MTMLEDIPVTVPDGPLSPVHAQAARIMRRAAGNLALNDEVWPHVAAGVVLALPELAAARAALERETELAPRLAALDARHQPRPWQGSVTGLVCTCGRGAYPCPDRLLLDGQLPETPEVDPT